MKVRQISFVSVCLFVFVLPLTDIIKDLSNSQTQFNGLEFFLKSQDFALY